MKLVELLAKEMREWPEMTEGGTRLEQDINNAVIEGDGCGTYDLFMLSQRADDYSENPHITRAQWQAERDRQKGGEWKRHRGGKQPVADGTEIEYKLRDGTIGNWAPERLEWDHTNHGGDIMQYRIISQPQAEEVEVIEPISTHKEFEVTGQWHQIDGPIKWRDTIIHCQAIIEDCEREIQRNVDLLDAEGLMMQADSKKAMQHYAPDVLPIEEWQIGDIVEVTSVSDKSGAPLGVFEITDIDSAEPKYELDDSYFPNHNQMKFIRRP